MALASFETYIGGRSHLHSWTPRLKLVSLGLLMFAFAAVKHLQLVIPMLGITAILYGLSGLPLSFLRRRLRYPGLFILAVVLVLPFGSGETILAQLGPIALRHDGAGGEPLLVNIDPGLCLTGHYSFFNSAASLAIARSSHRPCRHDPADLPLPIRNRRHAFHYAKVYASARIWPSQTLAEVRGQNLATALWPSRYAPHSQL